MKTNVNTSNVSYSNSYTHKSSVTNLNSSVRTSTNLSYNTNYVGRSNTSNNSTGKNNNIYNSTTNNSTEYYHFDRIVTNVNISSNVASNVNSATVAGKHSEFTITSINRPNYSKDGFLTNVNSATTNVNLPLEFKISNELCKLKEDGKFIITDKGKELGLDIILDEQLADYVDVENISNVEQFGSQVVVTFDDGSTVKILNGDNKFVVGNDEEGSLNFGYYIDENNNLNTIDIFGEYNMDSYQYGGNQMHFSEHMTELLEDPLIMNEILAHYPGATYDQCANYLWNIMDHGCGYISYANAIIKHFQGREQDFKEKFGFDMYKVDENGNLDYNYEPLILKWYTFNWGTGEYSIDYFDTATSYEVMEKYDEFAASYGINLTVLDEYNESYFNKTDVINEYNRIVNDLGTTQMEMTAWEFDLYDLNGNLVSPNTGCHAMYVIGMTDSGDLLVSSWGEKLILDLESLEANGGGMYFYNFEMEG